MPPKTILLAEDDADDRDFFHAFLKGRDDLVLLPPVENGEEVLRFLESVTNDAALPDAIILDQNMPKRNGLQTLRLLKNSDAFAHIPVLVYSTYTDEDLVKQSTAIGAALVLPKPATAEGYHKMIDAFFDVLE